jgi:hypothetical protein
MRLLGFLSRLAFICNICFLLSVTILMWPDPPVGEIISLIIIIGYSLAIVINGIVNIGYGISLLARKSLRNFIPLWLIIANFLFLLTQLILFLK